MNIEQALKETGFVRCSFKSDGDDKCDLCSKPIKKGADVFYNRTCYEVDEGEYYCESCTIKTPERWKQDEVMDTSYVLSQEVSGTYGQYKWKAFVDESLGGETLTYYHAIAPNGEIFCDTFTSGPLKDGVESCKAAIENHMCGDYE